MDYDYFLNALDQLEKESSEIAGSWNGDNPGRLEERAGAALEIIDEIGKLRENIEYLKTN